MGSVWVAIFRNVDDRRSHQSSRSLDWFLSKPLEIAVSADLNRIGETDYQMVGRGRLMGLDVVTDCQDQRVGREPACTDSEQLQGISSSEVLCRTVIDLDDFDDDVLPSSLTSFCEARKRSQKRNRSVTACDDAVEIREGSVTHFGANKRKKNPQRLGHSYDNHTEVIDLEASPRIQGKKVNGQEPAPVPQQVPVPVAPTFSCPICMDKLKNETSTKCGHIFCEVCIKKALAAKKSCPTCRKKLRVKDIFRVYLPDVSRE